ncbi:restriction endonuclease subunit S [Flavonifractor plautii]|uniref:restriction endonuclease subunit S n=1 Tax=Flavonifractor plautii TaxID=292800 RepID=UPI00195B3DBE|nr:restriction endonuclease subunit S [Flavonifractor plautii]MBM6790068.1 restriction endonuclease subunit S [Flavonifractor plautii]MCR1922334.1 restriction endonuclease subunit S [Flavonifractor plautii]MDU3012109.1 restriction endonuclease subunit S [Flavonifractor plautii]
MRTSEQQVLNFVRFVDLSRWSASSALLKKIKSSYPLLPLSCVLKRIKEPVVIEDKKRYRRITVRLYGQGVIERDELYGKDIGTKRQFIAREGQLIISRIDARNGAFGIVPKELDGAVVTNDFWLFNVNNALPQYLMLVLSSKRFQEYWETQSSGTTNRQRVDEEDFLRSKIALPPLEIQKELLDKYNSLINESVQKDQEIAQLEKSIDEYFLNTLGVRVEDIQKNNGSLIHQINYSVLSRWDVWSQTTQYISLKYSFSKFGSVVKGKPIYGANCKGIKKKSDVRYIRITDINEDGSLNDDFVSAEVVEEKYLLEENDFLIARSGNTVGKTFLYKPNMGKCIFAGYLVKYILNPQVVVPEYVLYYTKSSLFKSWVKNNQRIFGQPNINGQEYLNADLIVPTLAVQKEIVKTIESKRIQIDVKKKESKELILLAKCQFEEAVFGEA